MKKLGLINGPKSYQKIKTNKRDLPYRAYQPNNQSYTPYKR